MSEQKGNKKMVDAITPMEEDFAKWYTDIVKKAELMDYKSRLQIEIQKETTSQIHYVLTSESGTAQDKNFEMSCVLDGIILGMGSGSSKKKAEQDAARNALEKRVK